MEKSDIETIDPHNNPRLNDVFPVRVYHVALWGIIIITGICVLGIVYLTAHDKTNEGLISIASDCVGGLVGIFSQRSTGNSR